MTTNNEHRITSKVATCETTLSRTSTQKEIDDCIRIGRQLIMDASDVALLLREPKVLKSKQVKVLTKHATTLSTELVALSTKLTAAETTMKKAASLTEEEDETYMMASLSVSGDIMDATERFMNVGVKAASKIESISNHIIGGGK